MVIAVDFDGTIIENGYYPNIGLEIEYAFEVLKYLKSKGHKLILWTCREDKSLQLAIDFCKEHGIVFDRINENYYNANTRKIIADLYIDDLSYQRKGAKFSKYDWIEIGSRFGM